MTDPLDEESSPLDEESSMRENDTPMEGDSNEVFLELYNDLRSRAGKYMRAQRDGHTLQPTALVHEAFLRIYKSDSGTWRSREHFLAVASKAMMHVLIDYARGKKSKKRNQEGERVGLEGVLVHFEEQAVNILDLKDKLAEYAAMSPVEERAATVVRLRAFAGLTMPEIAAYLGTPQRTIERDFKLARAWLHRALGLDPGKPD